MNYFVKRSGKLYGPLSMDQLAKTISRDIFTDKDLVSKDQIKWEDIANFKERERASIAATPTTVPPTRGLRPADPETKPYMQSVPPMGVNQQGGSHMGMNNHSFDQSQQFHHAGCQSMQDEPKGYASFWKKYAIFSGRARRSEYWMAILFNFLIEMGILIFCSIALGAESITLLSIGGGAFILFNLAIIIPCLSITVRRLHDINQPGVYILFALIPVVGGLILFVFSCMEGTQGPNQYGPDPKISPR